MREAGGALISRPSLVAIGDGAVDREIGEQAWSLASEIAAWREGIQKARIPKSIVRILALGSGSAYHAALAAAPAFAAVARIPMDVMTMDEFRVGTLKAKPGTLLLAVSNGEETTEVLAALRKARESGVPVLAMVNAGESPVAREADQVLRILAGPETAVIATKTYTSQLLNLHLLALNAGLTRGVLNGRQYHELERAAEQLPTQAESILCRDTYIRNCARKYQRGYTFFFVGRRDRGATALEAAFKMKEFCPEFASETSVTSLDRQSAKGIDARSVVVVVAPRGDSSTRQLATLKQLRARGAIVLAIATEADRKLANVAHHVFEIPDCGPFWSPVLETLPLQLLARHRAHELKLS